jgi:hypothetical protein
MSKIILNQKILAGKPFITETRIFVRYVLQLLSSRMSIENIIKEYPELNQVIPPVCGGDGREHFDKRRLSRIRICGKCI